MGYRLIASSLSALALACSFSPGTVVDSAFEMKATAEPREVQCPELGDGRCLEFDRIATWKGALSGSVLGKERVLCEDRACSKAVGRFEGRFAGRAPSCGTIEGEFVAEEELEATDGRLMVVKGSWELEGQTKDGRREVTAEGELRDVLVSPEDVTTGTLAGELDCD